MTKHHQVNRLKVFISGTTESGISESILIIRPISTLFTQKANKNRFLVYQYAFIAANYFFEDPKSFKEVLKLIDRKHWLKTLNIKYDKIKSRDTFVIVN